MKEQRALHCRCMIAVFPERTFPAFPLVVLLSCSSRNKLQCPGDYVPAPVVEEKKVHMV